MDYPAPRRFVEWLSQNTHIDETNKREYRYHSRSDSHSKALCTLIIQDIVAACTMLADHARQGSIVYAINHRHEWPNSGKKKAIDLAFGLPVEEPALRGEESIRLGPISQVVFSCEAKTCMTEHSKSQPRIFDELSSSHVIVHAGDPKAIAAGIAVVNIAPKFISPLRQSPGEPLEWTIHKQPQAAAKMIGHLRGLPVRRSSDEPGFDAFATIVINCDNQGPASLWTEAPAPQPGDVDHYDSFIDAIARAYVRRLSEL